MEAGLFIRLAPSISEKLRNAAVSFDTEVGDLVNGVLMRFLEEHGFYDDEDRFLTQEEVDRALGIKPEDLEDLSDVELEE